MWRLATELTARPSTAGMAPALDVVVPKE